MRGDQEPDLWGLKGLGPKDSEKVRVHNLLFFETMTLMRLLIRRGLPVLLENPATSRLWLCPQLQRLIRLRGGEVCKVDYCQYGQPWRKRTTFVAFNLPPLQGTLKLCCGVGGVCSRTHKPHLRLEGVAASGQFKTLLAQAYPTPLCRVLGAAIAQRAGQVTS